MSDARDFLASGELDQAIRKAFETVRARPLDVSTRFLLLDMLCLTAQWERALTQLEVLDTVESAPVGARESYRVLIQAERARRDVAAGLSAPGWLVEPPAWAADLVEGLDALRR